MTYLANPYTITLTYGAYSLTFVVSDDSIFQRVPIQTYEISYSSTNAAIIDNGLSDNDVSTKYEWNLIGIRLTETEWITLQQIYTLWAGTRGNVILDDLTLPIFEAGTRTRALATGGAETADGTISYYNPRCNVGFSEPPQLESLSKGNVATVSFQLSELDKLEA